MDSKGFTLVELLAALVVVTIISSIVLHNVYSSFSISKDEAYKIMKNNIVSAGYTYVEECNAETILCDFSFENNNQFNASILEEKGYFKNLISPIDGKDVGDCLILTANKSNGVVVVDLVDQCYR